MSKGWKGDSYRHSLAARGIVSQGQVEKRVLSEKNIKTMVKNNKRYKEIEWIGDMDLRGKLIVINDIQVGKEAESYLDFDGNDRHELIGFMHRHPNAVYPEFSITDYSLAVQIKRLRSKANLARTDGFTGMGMALNDDDVKLFMLKPTPETEKMIMKMARKPMSPLKELAASRKLRKKLIASGELKIGIKKRGVSK